MFNTPLLPLSMLYSRAFHCALLHRVMALHCSSDPASCLKMYLNSRDITEWMNGLWREAQGAAWRAKQSPVSIAHSRKIYRAHLAYTCSYLKVTVAIPNAHPEVHEPNAVYPLANTSAFAAVNLGWKKKKYCSYSSKVFLTLISKRILRFPNIINDQFWSNLISVLA